MTLCLIVKNCEKDLERALKSVEGKFDEICVTDTGSTDGTVAVAQRFGAKISHFKWTGKYEDARNFNYSQATGDWIVWMDSDDTIRGIDSLLKQIKEADELVSAIACRYEYAKDANDNVSVVQWKVRATRRGWYKWGSEGGLHEDLLSLRVGITQYNLDAIWEHHKFVGVEKDDDTRERNLKILYDSLGDAQLSEQKPLFIYNLANALFSYEQWELCAKLFMAFVEMDIWEEHEYIARVRLADCLSNLGNKEGAVQERLRAIGVRPDYPDAYWGLGKDFYDMGQFKKAEAFLKMCLDKPYPETIIVCNPRDYDFNPSYLLAQIYIWLSDPINSLKYLKKAKAYLKNSKDLDGLMKIVQRLVSEMKFVDKKIEEIRGANDDKKKIQKILEGLPRFAQEHPGISFWRNKYFVKKESSGKDVVIYCGQSTEEWSPESLRTGIGGSEEAVIQMSRRLVGLGWNVTVYNSIVSPQEFDGVIYRPFWEWNKNDKVDIFVSWRNAYPFSYHINAAKKYLWLHDVPRDNEFDAVRVANIDKIIVLSQYHRSLLPFIPDDKFLVSANGIDPQQFEQGVERVSHKCIYTSAPERGLKTLLELWPKVREEVPDATLYVYYGWAVYDKAYEGERDKMRWKNEVVELLNQPGVMTDFPRIGHDEIAKEMLSSQLFVYPCRFPEISCIAAMKAQAAGCVPVTTNYAALEETVQSGVKIDSDNIYDDPEAKQEFVESVVEQLKNPLPVDSKKFIEQFSWDNVANQWNNEFSS